MTQITPISYDHGVSDKKLLGETIGAFFDRAVETWRDREALVVRQQDVRWSWGELGRRVDDLAAGLLSLGLQPGDRVGMWAPNRSEWTLTQFATAKAGLVLVNVNPAYRRSELEYAMNKVECKALVLAPALKTSNYLEITADLVKAGKLPHLQHVVRLGSEKTPGMLNFDDVAAAGGNAERMRLAEIGPKLQFDDAINIQFTSGTTGHPKGATLSHHNILNNGYFVAGGLGLTPDDRLCIPVPLYHCFGMVMGNLGCLTHGSTMVYPAESFDPLATLQAIAEERCTALYGVPTMFIAQLDFDLRRAEFGGNWHRTRNLRIRPTNGCSGSRRRAAAWNQPVPVGHRAGDAHFASDQLSPGASGMSTPSSGVDRSCTNQSWTMNWIQDAASRLRMVAG